MFLGIVGFAVTAAAGAATLTVDCSAGEKIQDKVLVARPGDTILVSGTCPEHVRIPAEMMRITLDGQGKTTINAPSRGDVIWIRGREITVKRFTLSGGRDGIHLSGAAAGASAIIDGNLIQRTGRRGIHMDHGSVGRIAGNTIEDVSEMGIHINSNSAAWIGYVLIETGLAPNTIRNAGSHGIKVARGSTARIVGNAIVDNKGSGIFVNRHSQADVFGNSISGNAGNGISASHSAGVNLRVEDLPVKSGANQTDASSKNSGVGLSCSVGGYADGPLGTLSGTKGVKEIESSCVDRLMAP